MSRFERLLNLLQILRRYRLPVSGQSLAEELGVSIRTLYRDIASLQAQGAAIEGEPGVGYIMKPGFMLPPLMFSLAELEALMLGMRLVAQQGDATLVLGASNSLDKISAVLPDKLREELESCTLLTGAVRRMPELRIDTESLRTAIRQEKKLHLSYQDSAGAVTQRVVWPFALVYYDRMQILMGWCELRGGFRNFRTDRISEAVIEQQRYPRNRKSLLAEWRRTEYVEGRSILPESDSMSP